MASSSPPASSQPESASVSAMDSSPVTAPSPGTFRHPNGLSQANSRKRASPYCGPSHAATAQEEEESNGNGVKGEVKEEKRPRTNPSTPTFSSSSSSSNRPPVISPHPSRAGTPAQPPPRSRPSSRQTTPSLQPTVESPPKRQRRVESEVKTLPKLYQNTHTADLVILISDMLQELVALNDRIPLSGAGLTRFHSRAPPAISITDYLNRLSVHASLQPSILLSMVYYIDIFSTHCPRFVVSSLTVHRFLITAATVASKGLCDSFLTNSYYAKVGGLSLMELNMLELEFLVRVGWRIVPKAEVLEEYYKSLVLRLGGLYRLEEDEGG